ncbi:MAG: enoyl-CoA hydratase/isomerase family protein [Methylobacteriaceae bacterium]|nr:enoyl-CoA hydratase/isomerase family protein [Methylobacteriaceae bacterium]
MSEGPAATPPVSLAIAGRIAEIGLCAPPLNLVTRPLLRGLEAALRRVAAAKGVRCVILHGGAARAFCAGSDIREFAHLRETAAEEKILYEDHVLRALARLPMPTIAALDGPALGGGLELALACDLRVARAGISLGLTESRIGGLAANGSLRLARLAGPGRAKELLFTGATLDADTALGWGVVNRVAREASALETARALAAEIAERGPLSNRLAKQLVDRAFDEPMEAALGASVVAQQAIFDSDDLREGMRAFFDKRPPNFGDD